jgi:NTP pyrophosphatase (non-canonical NTP hydrolase)
MQFSEYQKEAMDFRLNSATDTYALLGLAGEVGELLSLFAKSIRDQTVLDPVDLSKELGDILWFIAAIADDNEIDLNFVAQGNLVKLIDRRARNAIQGSGDNR